MTHPALDALRWQFDMTWRLADQHVLTGLTDAMCLWEPAPDAWSVRPVAGQWVPDWADVEPDPAPTTSIAWTAWHLAWWWSETLPRPGANRPPAGTACAFPGRPTVCGRSCRRSRLSGKG